jgi:hypothetical protein
MFPVYGGKCFSREAVHNWVANVSLTTKRLTRRCGSGWERSQAGFDALIKPKDKCINVDGGFV